MATTAAARKTSTGTKLYIHTDCTCTRINGKAVKGLDTTAAAQAYAADNDMPWTLCKTSTPAEPVAESAAPPAQGAPEFEIKVENRDQFGKQRRDAVAALVEAMGANLTFKGIKNRYRTGNDGFAVQITNAPAALEGAVAALMADIENGLEAVIAEAKSEGLSHEWDANTRQKHYKNTARAYITAKGAQAAAELA